MSAPRLAYEPALDGIRGLAVAGILLFHSDFAWASGGFLGVSAFFTLSGFLITRLLLAESAEAGRIALGRFWTRRLRRLMPAALLTLAGVIAYGGLVASPEQLSRLRGDVLWTLAYVANWHFILERYQYLALFSEPSPVLHFWSLAIEEQFYAAYPLIVAGGLALTGGSRRFLAAAIGLLAAASAGGSALLYASGASLDRIYFGTDTRAAEFLVGGLLAAVLPGAVASARARRAIGGGGLLALILCLLLWTWASLEAGWLYQGALGLHALLTAAALAAAVQPGSAVRRLLSAQPLRRLGQISYGVYLFHWPIFLWLDPERTGLSTAPLLALRLALVFVLAELSYRFFEYPIRSGRALVRWRAAAAAPAVAVGLVAALWAVTLEAPSGLDFREAPQLRDEFPDDADLPRVAIFGDSTALRLSWGLVRWLNETRLGRPTQGLTRLGCGVADDGLKLGKRVAERARPDCAGLDDAWRRAIEEHEPDLALVVLGPVDLYNRRLPGDDRWREPGDPVFDDYLRGEILEAVDVLSARGALVVWLTLPVVDPPKGRRPGAFHAEPARTARYNELLREAETLRPDRMRVLEYGAVVDGMAADERRLLPDGVHLSRESAYVVMSEWLGEELMRAHRERGGSAAAG